MALRSFLALVPCVILAGLPACKSEQTEAKRDTSGDAGAARPRGVDKNLAEAVAAVAGNPAEASGPPPTGVFAPGAADKELKASDPPKFTLGGKGTPPLVQFGSSAAKTGKPLIARTEVSSRNGPQGGPPPLDLAFSVDPEKSAAPQDDVAKDPAALKVVVAKVTASKFSVGAGTALPPEAVELASKLKGSKIRLEVFPSGPARVIALELGKGAPEDFALVLQGAGDALVLAYLPYPAEPVGVGAYWLVTTREGYAGLDVVAYRMVKLEKLEGDSATLTVSTKRYVAGGQLASIGMQHQILEFMGNSNGQLTVAPSAPGNLQGLSQDQLGAGIHIPGQPQGRDKGTVQLQMRTQVAVQSK